MPSLPCSGARPAHYLLLYGSQDGIDECLRLQMESCRIHLCFAVVSYDCTQIQT